MTPTYEDLMGRELPDFEDYCAVDMMAYDWTLDTFRRLTADDVAAGR